MLILRILIQWPKKFPRKTTLENSGVISCAVSHFSLPRNIYMRTFVHFLALNQSRQTSLVLKSHTTKGRNDASRRCIHVKTAWLSKVCIFRNKRLCFLNLWWIVFNLFWNFIKHETEKAQINLIKFIIFYLIVRNVAFSPDPTLISTMIYI